MAPNGTLGPSQAGGYAEACEHGACCIEVHHCCAVCQKRLCHAHWDSSCPHLDLPTEAPQQPPMDPSPPPLPAPLQPPPCSTSPQQQLPPPPPPPPQSADTGAAIVRSGGRPCTRRLWQKTSVVEKQLRSPPKGGWPRCLHPDCENSQCTLLRLTGSKDGFKHFKDPDLKVCQECRRRP